MKSCNVSKSEISDDVTIIFFIGIVVKLSFCISIVVLTEQEAEFEDQKNELEKRIEANEKNTEKL